MNRVKIPMDLQDQVKKVEGLEAIKSRAEKMASEGADAFTVRGFINEEDYEHHVLFEEQIEF